MANSSLETSGWASEQAMRRLEREPLPANVGALITDAAARYGERAFASFFDDDIEISYRSLARRTAQLADGLNRMGIRRGTHVAVMLDTDVHYLLTWFALLRIGAVVAPLNQAYTARELNYVIRDAEAQFLIIHGKYLALLDELPVSPIPAGHVVALAGTRSGARRWEDIEASGREDFVPPEQPSLSDPANIQYTSGTTGLPKGAILPQSYWLLRGRVWNAQLHFPIARNLIAQPFHYVDGQAMLMLSLTGGGTAFVARRQSASRFMEWVKTFNIEFCSLPEIVTNAPERPDDGENSLKIAYCYSHRLSNYTAVEQRYRCVARQGYGMTELGSSLYVPVEATMFTGTGTVGIPSAFREVRIADEHGHTVPDGTVGEILVRGYSTFLGYFNRPEANAAARDAEGWFRTGDAGRRDDAGFFYYEGRRKDMIRRSGENVSALEIEGILRSLSGIAEAAVLPVPDDIRGEEIKAYIKLDGDKSAADMPPELILDHCRKNLARFKVPRYLEYVDEFPRTPGNKIKKIDLVSARPDLRAGSYDSGSKSWRSQ